MAIAVNRVVFARRGYWTIFSILVMVVKNYYRPGSEEEEVDCKENLKLYSERVAIERLKDMIENHAEAGTLPSKFNDQGERIFVSKGFKDWWFKYDMKTFVKSLNFEASNALYQVFEEMEKIGVANKGPLSEEKEEEKELGRRPKNDWNAIFKAVELGTLKNKYKTLPQIRGSMEIWEALVLNKSKWPGISATDKEWSQISGNSAKYVENKIGKVLKQQESRGTK